MKTVLIVLLALLCAVLIGRQITLERGLHRAARRMREQMADETTADLHPGLFAAVGGGGAVSREKGGVPVGDRGEGPNPPDLHRRLL